MQSQTKSSLELFSNNLINGLLIFVAVGLPLSLSRVFDTGFLPLYTVHILVTIGALLIFLNRKRLHYKAVINIACLILFSISLAGLYQLGLISHFLVYANATALIITYTYGIRAGVIFLLGYLLISAVFGYLFVNEILQPSMDLTTYASSKNAWLLVVLTGLLSNGLVLLSLTNMRKQLTSKIKELNAEKIKVEHLANHDALTGLALTRLAYDRMDSAISLANRSRNKVALLFIDLDKFKAVNDAHGHDAGDVVLKQVAHRLMEQVRRSDTVCRLGGDEFLIVLPEVSSKSEIQFLCTRLIKEIEKPILYKDADVEVSASIGVSFYPDNAEDLKSLRNQADKAMYEVKKSGRGSFKFS
jgi:diguanylate cyclase (GGDEF)-like protein